MSILKFRGSTALLALLFLLVLFGSLEVVARQPEFQSRLSYPRLGSRHSQLGPKYARLQALQREVGHVDCVAIGSSTMDQALDPVVFAAAYQAETGQPIHCFNFAIDAIAPSTSCYIAEILVEDFRPDLLIVGTDARDLTVAQTDRDVTVVAETPWVRYRSGQFDVRGWLMQTFYAYRYAWHFRQLLRGQLGDISRAEASPSVTLGQTPEESVDRGVTLRDPPHKDEGLYAYYHARLGNYQILPENTAGLREILRLNSPQTRVILVEMPVPAGFFHFFRDPVADYNAFLTQVQQLADLDAVPFWKTTELNLIPDNGWFDFSHVNTVGADAFSQWLGHQVGRLSSE